MKIIIKHYLIGKVFSLGFTDIVVGLILEVTSKIKLQTVAIKLYFISYIFIE
jgi:hypothetical protein